MTAATLTSYDAGLLLLYLSAWGLLLCLAAWLAEDVWPRLMAGHRRRMARVHRLEYQRWLAEQRQATSTTTKRGTHDH